MALIMVIDASLQGLALALVDAVPPAGSAAPLWQSVHLETRGSVALLGQLVDQGLRSIGKTAAAVEGLAVGVGPGSFTGIKAALAFAYGFGAAAPGGLLPCLGLSALGAAARAAAAGSNDDGSVLFLPATKTHGYFATCVGAQIQESGALIDLTSPASGLTLAGFPPSWRRRVLGSWPALDAAMAKLSIDCQILEPQTGVPGAICDMAMQAAAAWPLAFERTLATPRYLRLSTAEEKAAQGR